MIICLFCLFLIESVLLLNELNFKCKWFAIILLVSKNVNVG